MYVSYPVAAFCAARGMTSDEADQVYAELVRENAEIAPSAGTFFRDVDAAIAKVKANR